MKKLLPIALIGLSLVVGANAAEREATINIYGITEKVDKDHGSSYGTGIMYDSEAIKVKLEGTSDVMRVASILKFNPIDSNSYVKLGLNYLDQKIFAPDNTDTRVNQYSAAVNAGYAISEDLHVKLGGSYTNFSGKKFGNYEIFDEETSLAFLEIAKRFDSTPIGTFDITANAGKVYYEFKDDENFYGAGVDFYPIKSSKFGLVYQKERDNRTAGLVLEYSYLFTDFSRNIDLNTYAVGAGVKIAFTNVLDISTYKATTNKKSGLSEHRTFDNIVTGRHNTVEPDDIVVIDPHAHP